MQIGDLGWLNGEPPVVDRQIAIQELIRRVQRGDVREPHLLSDCGVRCMVNMGDQWDSNTGGCRGGGVILCVFDLSV